MKNKMVIERENEDGERLTNFIKENPFPDYDFVSYDLLLKQEHSLPQYAEDGEIKHDLIKEIYVNIFDADSTSKHGEEIRTKDSITTHLLYTIVSVKALDWPTRIW